MDIFEEFYQKHLFEFGPSAQGVGWKNHNAQLIRFTQLQKLLPPKIHFSVNDLGCGVGDLITFLSSKGCDFNYFGYDIMPEMILKARERHSNQVNANFQCIKNANEMIVSDYTIASGIFNIRFETSDEDWLKLILKTIDEVNEKSLRGFAFNVLSKYSDAEYRKNELYYADPLHLFNYCKVHFSKNVALLHDYDQYDFTIIVRK